MKTQLNKTQFNFLHVFSFIRIYSSRTRLVFIYISNLFINANELLVYHCKLPQNLKSDKLGYILHIKTFSKKCCKLPVITVPIKCTYHQSIQLVLNGAMFSSACRSATGCSQRFSKYTLRSFLLFNPVWMAHGKCVLIYCCLCLKVK